MRRGLARMVLALAATFAPPAGAHDARPLAITLTEHEQGRYLATIRVPPSVAADNRPVIEWPPPCRRTPDEEGHSVTLSASRIAMSCAGGLAGQRLGIAWPLYNPSLPALLRIETRDGAVISRVLAPDQRHWLVPARPGPWQVMRDYLKLGIGHIWGGIDHLLFVAALLLLAGTMRRVLLAVTGFTLAHSLTLSLAALDWVRLPVAPVEAAIALSILFLAREIAAPHPDSLARRHPVLVSASFGLLHGFGFAAALRDIGLPRGEQAMGLLSFNLGVEIGQILFIAAVLIPFWAIRRARGLAQRPCLVLEGGQRLLAGYGLGILAAFWFIGRALPVLA